MKRLNCKTRIYDADTLEYLGDYDENQVGIMKENETVLDFRTYWPTWLLLGIIFIILCTATWNLMDRYRMVTSTNKQLKEYIEVAEYDMNVELLAGRYATSRTPVPTDMNEVYKMCIQSGAWYPEVIMAQFIIESGTATSSVSKKARNYYGMKYIGLKGRPTLQIPDANVSGYGMYLNWQHSVLDRVLWDDWVFNKTRPETREKYLAKINGVYAEDPNYISKVMSVAREWEAKTDSLRMVMERDSITIIQ
mgnify:CR=1 FL=1